MSSIQNRERLREKLRALPDAIRKEIQAPMEKSAQAITDLAIHLAPRRHGALKNSIDWCFGDPPPAARLSNKVRKNKPPLTQKDIVLSVFAGNDLAFYARWVEFGTHASRKGSRVPDARTGRTRRSYRTHPGTKAQPFFYPAYRANKKQAATAIKSAVTKALKKVAGTP